MALRGKGLAKAKKFLEDVLAHKRVIPFHRFCGGVGRTGQAKNEGSTTGQGRWPTKSCEFLLGLLKNAESNAEVRSGGPPLFTDWSGLLADWFARAPATLVECGEQCRDSAWYLSRAITWCASSACIHDWAALLADQVP